MTRKKILAVLLFILLIGGIISYLLLVQHEFTKTLHIKLPILTVTEQFNSPGNLRKWFRPFLNAAHNSADTVIETRKAVTFGKYHLEVINTSIYSCILNLSDGKNSKKFFISAIPDTSKGGQTMVNLTYRNSYLKEWLFPGELTKKGIASFVDFDEYLQDTKRVYGYEIYPVKVVDTLFLFKRETVPIIAKRAATKSIFERLIAYAAKKDLEYDGNRIFFSQQIDDSITLFASIGIARDVVLPENESYEIKRMPFEKNLLEANYLGPYGEVQKAFDALKKYLVDHNISSIAIPFQKFISDGYDFADDQVVQMKIYCPVF